MPDASSFSEIDRQHLELLPARTVMSIFMAAAAGENAGSATDGATGPAEGTQTADPMTFGKVVDYLASPATNLIFPQPGNAGTAGAAGK